MKFQKFYESKKKTPVVVFAGRFQPFHVGHKETYDNLVEKFGKDNVYIATSNKVELPKSPFRFAEKRKIIRKMFKIPSDKIVQVKNPYAPLEVLEKYPKNSAYVAVVGKKDADRLMKGKYFDMYKDDIPLDKYEDKGYIYVAPQNTKFFNGKRITGTLVREVLKDGSAEDKMDLFNELYPKFNQEIFDLVINKIRGE